VSVACVSDRVGEPGQLVPKGAQHSPAAHVALATVFDVQGTGGHAPRFFGIFLALGFSRFVGESTLPPTAANAPG
jgi:hypothetical protein